MLHVLQGSKKLTEGSWYYSKKAQRILKRLNQSKPPTLEAQVEEGKGRSGSGRVHRREEK